jgi:hypothetical protein
MRGNWRQTYTNGYICQGRVFVTNTEGTSVILFIGFPSDRLLRQTIESSKGLTHITLNTIFFARIVGAA